ncbi:LOW QUALITY PROTEIN: hypothetical protein PHMEG_00015916 [Phytophthora megakarya]|uniref:Uncharacterized protein n=1 Tax=Phytophthora megakarya TaxID=4795 RepID=A0A225W1Q1_9STRA|nr:LOW QUALITY PROTEIN: hypothetical protein PHMEG_00015916 [Phytophthora megakarya]
MTEGSDGSNSDSTTGARPSTPGSTLYSGREQSFSTCNRYDVHAYAQRAWYLVSNFVTKPIDEATKVVTFMKGLRDGPVKKYLFREYPCTLEAAITLGMQEELA